MSNGATGPRLAALGLTALQENAYRYLVAAGEARPTHRIGQALGLAADATTELLTGLEAHGLATRSRTGYRASPPEAALGALLSRRDEELHGIRLLAAELQGHYSDAVRGRRTADFVEVVHGPEQVNRYYLHLVRGARSGLDVLTKPPYVAVGPAAMQTLDAENTIIRRGVRSRSVYDGDALDEADTLAIARQSMEIGEEARSAGDVPFKLAIADRRVGFLPLDIRSPALGALIVHASALLEALIALFEGIWARALPMRTGPLLEGLADLPPRASDVLRLMAAGLKDEAIARALNLSRRTVQKYVTDIMNALGARNRFQAALLANDRGWIGSVHGG